MSYLKHRANLKQVRYNGGKFYAKSRHESDYILMHQSFNCIVDSDLLIPNNAFAIFENGILDINTSENIINNKFSNYYGVPSQTTMIRDIIPQSGGKTILTGSISHYEGVSRGGIVRINSDWTTDNSFSSGTGTSTGSAAGTIFSSASDSNGKMVLGGGFSSYNGNSCNNICRINSDGSFDSSFNIGTGFNSQVRCVRVRNNGKILCSGLFSTFNGTSVSFNASLNSDGTLDTSFFQGTGFNSIVWMYAEQDDGKIVCVGQFTSYNGTTVNRIARLNTDGTLDTTFNNGGTGFNNGMLGVWINNGYIYATGFPTTYNGVGTAEPAVIVFTKLDSSGSAVWLAGDPEHSSRAYQPYFTNDNKIICGIQSQLFSMSAINDTDGTFDNSFQTNLGLGSYGGNVETILKINDKIICSGFFNWVTKSNYFEPIGSIIIKDKLRNITFTHPRTSCFEYSWVTAIKQSDGKIVFGGSFSNRFGNPLTGYQNGTTLSGGIVRMNTDGSIDNTFSSGTGFSSSVNQIIQYSPTKMLVSHNGTSYNGTATRFLTLLNNDGTIDSSYAVVGTGLQSSAASIVVQEDGKIIAVGNFTTVNGTTVNRIVRLNVDGTIDSAFLTNTGTGLNSYANRVYLDKDNKIILLGNFTTINGVTKPLIGRLNSDGTLDNTFSFSNTGSPSVYALGVLSDNKYIISGNFTSYAGNSCGHICRLNNDGSFDSGFNSNESGFTSYVGNSNYYYMQIQDDDIIVLSIGGSASIVYYNDTMVRNLIAITRDGELINNFSSEFYTAIPNRVLFL